MGNHALVYTTLISLGIAVIYCSVGLIKRKLTNDHLVSVIAVLVSTGSLISGIKLIINTIVKSLADDSNKGSLSLEDTDFYFTIIGGIAVAWLASFELHKRFKELLSEKLINS